MTTYDARYQPPFAINARVRINPNFAALYPPAVRKQGAGIVGAHVSYKTGVHRSNVHFPDGSEFPIRDEHLLAGDESPPAVPPTAAAPAEPVAQVVCRRTKPSRRGHGGSSGSPMSPDACPLGKDPRWCDEHSRQPWEMDARFYRCTQAGCGHVGRFVERERSATAKTTATR